MLVYLFSKKLNNRKNSIKSAESIKAEINAIEKIEMFKQICQANEQSSEKVFQ